MSHRPVPPPSADRHAGGRLRSPGLGAGRSLGLALALGTVGCTTDSADKAGSAPASSAQGAAVPLRLLDDDSTLSRTVQVTARGRALAEDGVLEGLIEVEAVDLDSAQRCTQQVALRGLPSARCPACDWASDLETASTPAEGCSQDPLLTLLDGQIGSTVYRESGLGWIAEERSASTTESGRTEVVVSNQLVGIFELGEGGVSESADGGASVPSEDAPSADGVGLVPLAYTRTTTFVPFVDPPEDDEDEDGGPDTGTDPGTDTDTGAPDPTEPTEGEPIVTVERFGAAALVGSALQWTLQKTVLERQDYGWCEGVEGFGTFGGDDNGSGLGRAPLRPTMVDSSLSVSGELGCLDGRVDVWTIEASEGEEFTVLVDTISADTTFDAALTVATADRCRIALGDDEHSCTHPPAAYGCPSARVRAPADGLLHVVVQSLGVCAGPVAEYRLSAARNNP